MINSKKIFLVAGGSGGHIFPAESLYLELTNRGFDVHILIDKRSKNFIYSFTNTNVHIISSDTIFKKNVFQIIFSIFKLIKGAIQSYILIKKFKPVLIGGFGGYPTIPTLFIANIINIPTFIHEQNIIMGRANLFLAKYTNIIAGAFPKIINNVYEKFVYTGNPIRKSFTKKEIFYHPSRDNMPFFLLVIGGSQGTKFFSTIMPHALSLLKRPILDRIIIFQQARFDDLLDLNIKYKKMNIKSYIRTFFKNIAELMIKSHYIISRSGGSILSEILTIGRPALLIPYPNSVDNDQMENAKMFSFLGGIKVIKEKHVTPLRLAVTILNSVSNPDLLLKMAKKNKSLINIKASEKLANIVEGIIANKPIDEIKKEINNE